MRLSQFKKFLLRSSNNIFLFHDSPRFNQPTTPFIKLQEISLQSETTNNILTRMDRDLFYTCTRKRVIFCFNEMHVVINLVSL